MPSPLKSTALHPKFGKTIHGVDLRKVTATHLYPQIRAAFEHDSALLFRDQSLDDAAHENLARLFGPLENRESMASGDDLEFSVSSVSNQTRNGVADPDSLHLLDLQGNMLWHTDSTFLPIPALANILIATTVPSRGGQTELASTRAGWAEMPPAMQRDFNHAVLWHRLSHSRARISPELAALPRMTRWPDRPWRAIWPNPVTGEPALYIASHAFAVEGMGLRRGQSLIDSAIEFCTRPENVYSHTWRPGDVLIWDERAILHRGRPWPYAEPRTLKSICCSATDADGLATVRIV